jgi:S1-C subfamily serine protease
MSSWVIAVCAGSVGALVAVGVIGATGGLRRDVNVFRPNPDRVRAVSVSTQPTPDDVVEIAQRARAALAHVSVRNATGTVSGSGVMFHADGYIVTNWHLVDGARSIRVVVASGKELPGLVIGSDRDTDLALVKVDGGPYPVAELGTAAHLSIGERAIALGSPLGLSGDPSVSVGVVSALHREVEVRGIDVPLLDMIQTDALISPGSSGGALLDRTGKVIGITTADAVKLKRLGFATPIETARMVAAQLLTTGRFTHVWLGIEGSDMDSDLATQLGVAGGARVDRVVADGPAERAGVQPRDVIIGIDGEPVVSMGALVVSLRGRPAGQAVVLDVIRGMQRRELRVTVIERPERP